MWRNVCRLAPFGSKSFGEDGIVFVKSLAREENVVGKLGTDDMAENGHGENLNKATNAFQANQKEGGQ